MASQVLAAFESEAIIDQSCFAKTLLIAARLSFKRRHTKQFKSSSIDSSADLDIQCKNRLVA